MTHEYTIPNSNDNVRSCLDQLENEPPSLWDVGCEILLGYTESAYKEMQEYAERGE